MVVALALIAAVAFVRSTAGPAHPAALSHTAAPPVSSAAAATTTVPVSSAPSMDAQVSAWWSGTAEPMVSALVADLEAVPTRGAEGAAGSTGSTGGTVATDPSVYCGALSRDTATAAAAPAAPATAIEREWTLTVSTSTRASAACSSGRFTSLAGDLQPALYTLRDLSDQVKPYLAGESP